MKPVLLATLLLAPLPQAAPGFRLETPDGSAVTEADFRGRKAVVLVFGGIECPRSVASLGRLGDLAAAFGPKGVAVHMVDPNWCDTREEIADFARRSGAGVSWLVDPGGRAAARFKVEIQPTAVLLDGTLEVAYRGLIDDHKVEELVRTPYLRRALEAVLAGRAPEVRETKPAGCTIKVKPAAETGKHTWAKDVAPILDRHCVSCHRPGQVAPFSLAGYEQARAWAPEIASAAGNRSMPPWKPVGNEGLYHDERRLSEAEIGVLDAWMREGSPSGDLSKAPPAPAFDESWMLGTPDAVLRAEGGYVLGPKGRDDYRCYVLRNPFDTDVWVAGLEFRPGNPRAVHHIIGYLDSAGQGARRDAEDPGPGYRSNGAGPMILPSGSFSGWAPGNMPRMLPPGVARQLRRNEWIILETHYHRTGRPETDSGTQVAVYLAKGPVRKKLHVHSLLNPLFVIPPGVERHEVVASWIVPKPVTAFDVMPHMHLLGREVSVTATLPDGTVKTLVAIKDWDFNWQETYQFKTPVPLPRGTRVKVTSVYDNSATNPNNPSNPPKPVRWGEQTTDEMCIAFIHFTNDREDLAAPKKDD